MAHHEAYRHSFQIILIIKWEIMEFTTLLFAIMQILIENHWKIRKCKFLILLATFHYPDEIWTTNLPIDFVSYWKNKLLNFEYHAHNLSFDGVLIDLYFVSNLGQIWIFVKKIKKTFCTKKTLFNFYKFEQRFKPGPS